MSSMATNTRTAHTRESGSPKAELKGKPRLEKPALAMPALEKPGKTPDSRAALAGCQESDKAVAKPPRGRRRRARRPCGSFLRRPFRTTPARRTQAQGYQGSGTGRRGVRLIPRLSAQGGLPPARGDH